MEVAEGSARADHVVGAVLIRDAHIAGVAQPISKRRNHRIVGPCAPPDYDPAKPGWLVEYIGAFLRRCPGALNVTCGLSRYWKLIEAF